MCFDVGNRTSRQVLQPWTAIFRVLLFILESHRWLNHAFCGFEAIALIAFSYMSLCHMLPFATGCSVDIQPGRISNKHRLEQQRL
jgi:hypothetical protein